jgi:hypothetical protein
MKTNMQGVRTGTHHYVTTLDAKQAYGSDYDDAIKEGRIAVGKPTFNPETQKLVYDSDGRYWLINL